MGEIRLVDRPLEKDEWLTARRPVSDEEGKPADQPSANQKPSDLSPSKDGQTKDDQKESKPSTTVAGISQTGQDSVTLVINESVESDQIDSVDKKQDDSSSKDDMANPRTLPQTGQSTLVIALALLALLGGCITLKNTKTE